MRHARPKATATRRSRSGYLVGPVELFSIEIHGVSHVFEDRGLGCPEPTDTRHSIPASPPRKGFRPEVGPRVGAAATAETSGGQFRCVNSCVACKARRSASPTRRGPEGTGRSGAAGRPRPRPAAATRGDSNREHGQIADLHRPSSKRTDPFGELKVFAGSSSRALGRAICDQLGMRAGPFGDHGLQRRERLRPGAGERPRPRRLHRAGHRLPGQRQLRRAALLDRRLQARQRHPGHGGHPLSSRTPRETRKTSPGSRSGPGSAPTVSRPPGPTAC